MDKIIKATYGPNVPVSVSGRRYNETFAKLAQAEIDAERGMLDLIESADKSLGHKSGCVAYLGTSGDVDKINDTLNNPQKK